MAQTIKIKRGGIASLVSTTPTLAQGELLLATGSLNGLGSTFFVASASNSPSLPYAKIETITNGAALASSLDANFTGLLIHSASDNKLYRYNGSAFVELPIAAGSFVGVLPVINGGTGVSELDDIVGDTKIIVTNGTNTIIGGDVTLSLGGGVVSGSSQITYSGISGIPSGIVSGSSQITYSGISGIPSGIVSGSSQITYSGISGIPSGIVSASVLSSPNQGSVLLTTNGVAGSTIDLGLQTGDSPTFAGLTLSTLANQGSEATAVVINGSGVVGTRELGSNAFTSTTIGTTTSALTDGDGIQDFTFNGSSPATVAIEATQTTITSVKNDSLVVGSATGNDIIDFGTSGNVIIKTNNQARVTINDSGTTIAGNLTVTGTTTSINTTNLDIGDNIITLNGAGGSDGGIQVNDATGTTTSGSLLWKTGTDYWVAGALGSEKRIPLQDADMAANTIVLGTGVGTINNSDAFTSEADGYYLKWNGTAFAKTNVIDGGTF